MNTSYQVDKRLLIPGGQGYEGVLSIEINGPSRKIQQCLLEMRMKSTAHLDLNSFLGKDPQQPIHRIEGHQLPPGS